MWNKEELKNYQVIGRSIQSIMAAFGSFTLVASKFLLEEGIGTPDETMVAQIDPDAWYPLDRWVRVFDRVHGEFGNFTVRQVGMQIPKHVQIPPQFVDAASAIQLLDIGYHMNHGINGVPLFNPATGEMKEGIGHYRATGKAADKKFTCESDVPFPCAFDEGLVLALVQRFTPSAIVTHDKGGCRMKGAKSCLYHITWK
jgi:hypothetical protein